MVDNTLPIIGHDDFRKRFNKYTKKAFQMLPKLETPHILDIGCGSGVPTLELVRLSKGNVIGIDTDQSQLGKLKKKIKDANLTYRVKALKCSLLDMKFPDESFDIIWAEGSISIIGFEKCLKEWRRFIKPNGFLVLHDEVGDLVRKLELISAYDYKLIDHFTISEDIWWTEYYYPWQKQVQEFRKKHQGNSKALAFLDSEQSEIDKFHENPKLYESVFFVMQKDNIKLKTV